MKLLAEISDATVGIGPSEKLGEHYQLKKNVRVILENDQGHIAVQHLQNYKFYKLPGGGVEAGETLEAAAMREVLEEVGCTCTIIRPVGMIIEYREKYKIIQINYCFVASVTSPLSAPAFEAAEIAAGQTNIWVEPAVGIELITNGEKSTYESHFNIPREIAFLQESLKTT